MSLAAISLSLWCGTIGGLIGLIIGYRLGKKDSK